MAITVITAIIKMDNDDLLLGFLQQHPKNELNSKTTRVDFS
jgi:hypothetical protein